MTGLVFLYSPAFTFAATPIRIGEVAWAGSSLSTADEWLELWNVGDAPVSLAGWSLRGASDAPIIFPSDATIEPRGVFLISNYAASETKSVLAAEPRLVTTAVSLSNSALTIELLDETGAVIDGAGAGNAPPAGASLPIKTSMVRDGDLWVNAASSQNMKPGVSDFGTPGMCDGCVTNDQSAVVASSTDVVPDVIATSTTEHTAATTTEPVVSAIDATTTTDTTTTTTETALASTTADVATAPVIMPAPPPVVLPPPPAEKPKPNYGMLRLNEISPAPAAGKEWIEIVSLDASQKIPLRGCELHDANGRIATLGNLTIDPSASRYLVVTLARAKLKNDGESVALYDPNGRLLDVMRFPATPKGASWIRFPDLLGDWQATASSTPGGPNALAAPATASDAAMSKAPDDALLVATTTRELAALAADETRESKAVAQDEEREEKEQREIEALVTAAPAAVRKPPAVARTARRASSSPRKPIIPFTFTMLLNDDIGGLRVRLTGRVGSPPGLLANHSFILQAPDGRGIAVRVPSRMRLPRFGSDVSVVGTLRLDDRGTASLQMGTRDAWTSRPTTTESVLPRVVDLTAPAAEDAWSLVRVTGTVAAVKGQTLHLDLNDAELDVVVKPAVKYRVKRLVPGDVVSVAGVLDISREDDAKLLPRTADELAIVKHADEKSDGLRGADGLPSWAPLSAAGGAVVATEGARYWNRRRKIWKLEKKAKETVS